MKFDRNLKAKFLGRHRNLNLVWIQSRIQFHRRLIKFPQKSRQLFRFELEIELERRWNEIVEGTFSCSEEENKLKVKQSQKLWGFCLQTRNHQGASQTIGIGAAP
jgi:hypothetical protein